MISQPPTPLPLPLCLLAGAGLLVLLVWIYLWLFHHRFWTTRIPPIGTQQGNVASPASDAADCTPPATGSAASAPYTATESHKRTAETGRPFASDSSSEGIATALKTGAAPLVAKPSVLVVVPARNEAEVIARTVADVLSQNYDGALHLIVVNDNSRDDTAALAGHSAAETLALLSPQLAAKRRFSVINGSPLPDGWSGKLWAVEQGIRHGLYPEAGAQKSSAPTDNTQSTGSRQEQALQPRVTAQRETDRPPYAEATAAAASICAAALVANPDSVRSADTNEVAQFIWLTDADISHKPQVLEELIARACSDNRALVSRMALLCTDTVAERWTIPAFVYFFQMLYPFRAIADKSSGIHGAAGGCILLERAYLEKIGGIASLRGALIDDCTLADHVARAGGHLWLELTKSSVSQRGYGGIQGVSDMIARTAYTQLHYSPLRLTGTVFGLIFTFFCPLLLPLAAITLLALQATPADTSAATAASENIATLLPAAIAIGCPLLAAAIMFGTFVPMLRFYGRSPLRALGLPVIASFYLSATIKSAVRHYRGKTGNWKGRVYQNG